MKANNGIYIVDDLGRQQVGVTELLNRWIVPLDRRVDMFSLRNGVRFSVPFDVWPVFSTNLEPSDLGDEAYRAALADVGSAVDALTTIPDDLRSAESGTAYASSANLQLTLYQSIYSVMYLNLFAVNAQTGQFDASQLSTMTEDDATVVVSGLEAAAEAQAATDPALKAQIDAAIGQINDQSGVTNKDKLAAFLAAKNAANGSGSGSGLGTASSGSIGSVLAP